MPRYLQPRSKNATLDGNGNGQVAFTVDGNAVRWIVDYVNVQTSQAPGTTPIPQCRFYLNGTDPQHLVGGTNSGNLDTAQGRTILDTDSTLYAVWSGGIPATTAIATIAGVFYLPGESLEAS